MTGKVTETAQLLQLEAGGELEAEPGGL